MASFFLKDIVTIKIISPTGRQASPQQKICQSSQKVRAVVCKQQVVGPNPTSGLRQLFLIYFPMDKNQTAGHLHPISSAILQIREIFAELDFEVAEGPELEDEWHNLMRSMYRKTTHPEI